MNTALNSKLSFFIKSVLIPLLIVKLLYSLSLFFLEKRSVEFYKERDFRFFYRGDLASKIIPNEKVVENKPKITEPTLKLESLVLKATFVDPNRSFIVIEDGKKSIFLDKGEVYKGYKLIEVYKDRAVFTKGGKNYEISIKDTLPKEAQKALEDEESVEEEMPEFIPGGLEKEPPKTVSAVTVSRNTIERYIENPNLIWKNIKIDEIKKGGKIKGFKVRYVKKGSYFDKLGLKSGDIIKAIDGREFRSIAQVMHYYNNISKINALTLTIVRGGEEMELFFDIH